MRIDVDDALIDTLANLARLELPETEKALLRAQLDRILAYFAQLEDGDVEDDLEGERTASMDELRNDRAADSLSRDALLGPAPDAADGFFRVPRVIDPDLD